MEETLTDCLVRVREDLSQLNKVRDYLNTNSEKEEPCSFTWRTIEAFNSLLSVCSSQSTPETNALNTLLDSFYYLARNNNSNSVWNDFDFELGIICVKVLSAIERTEIFEVLFYKLLSVINIISEHNSNVWKAAARQILNVMINKKFSLSYFETILKLYISILRNVESFALYDFSMQNLHLLKTLSLLVQSVGDFEIQSGIVELVFLHLSKDTKLMSDFFPPVEKKVFHPFEFTNFENDCRLYLNALNKSRRGFERKVYSLCCHDLCLGGLSVEPPIRKNYFWIDANKDSERVSIKYGDTESEENRIIYIQFSDMIKVQPENGKTEENRSLTIQTKNLMELHEELTNDDIYLVAENEEEMYEFVHFLETAIGERKMKKSCGKVSKTKDTLLIDRNNPRKEIQEHRVTSSERPGIDNILPDVMSLFEKTSHITVNTEMQFKTSQSSKPSTAEMKTSPRNISLERKVDSQNLSPNSFVESLNKHIGLDSSELRHTFEDSVETIEFLQETTPKKSHKLFTTPDKIFNISETKESDTLNFIFGKNKENNPPDETVKPNIKTYSRKLNNFKETDDLQSTKILRDRKNLEAKLTNSQSQDYFRGSLSVIKKKKPFLPKLKRSKRSIKKLKIVKESKTQNKQPQSKNASRSSEETKQKDNQKNANLKMNQSKSTESKEKKVQVQNKQKKEQENNEQLKKSGENESEHKNEFKVQHKTRERQISTTKKKEPELEKKHSEAEFQQKNEYSNPNPDEINNSSGHEADSLGNHSKKKRERRLEENAKPGARQEKKPSLLDPNGYAYLRWCKPTTSERSNFWLKKLDALRKPKSDSTDVFDFSDETDSVLGKHKKKKQRIVHSKRKIRSHKKTQQTSLREVKEILKKASPVKTTSSPIRQKHPKAEAKQSLVLPPQDEASLEILTKDLLDTPPSNHTFKRSSSSGSVQGEAASNDSEYESVLSSEQEELQPQNKKRERSDEESSSAKGYIKKKKKITFSKSFISTIRLRLQKTEEKDRHYTDEIIQTIQKAANHLLNHLQRKEAEMILPYLTTAEEVSTAFGAKIKELNIRAKRIQSMIAYFKDEGSVSDFSEISMNHFSRMREGLTNLRKKRDTLKTIDRITDRLNSLILTEIDKSIKNEWASKRNKMLKFASLLGADIKEL